MDIMKRIFTDSFTEATVINTNQVQELSLEETEELKRNMKISINLMPLATFLNINTHKNINAASVLKILLKSLHAEMRI